MGCNNSKQDPPAQPPQAPANQVTEPAPTAPEATNTATNAAPDGEGLKHQYSGGRSLSRSNSAFKGSRNASRTSFRSNVSFKEGNSFTKPGEGAGRDLGRSPSMQRELKGGEEVPLTKIVSAFYDALLADERMLPFFADGDVSVVKARQGAIMEIAFGDEDPLSVESEEGREELAIMKDLLSKTADASMTSELWAHFIELFEKTIAPLDIPDEKKACAASRMKSTQAWFSA